VPAHHDPSHESFESKAWPRFRTAPASLSERLGLPPARRGPEPPFKLVDDPAAGTAAAASESSPRPSWSDPGLSGYSESAAGALSVTAAEGGRRPRAAPGGPRPLPGPGLARGGIVLRLRRRTSITVLRA
jgi:hypothetical protein